MNPNFNLFTGSVGFILAERTGFEPAEAVNLARFPSVCLKPLDHLSVLSFFRFCCSGSASQVSVAN